MKFRKKPVVIEAWKWQPDDKGKNELGWPIEWGSKPHKWLVSAIDLTLFIPTLEGEMKATNGDWIIKGIKGEFYPCKPDIFEATYEKA
jgi:hypothetical protein